MEIKSDLSKSISILICSRDRRRDLERLIESIKNLDSDRSPEIVVVEETDNPIQIDGIRYIPHPIANRGIPYARNLALANATGEIIVFLDDDCRIRNGWLDNLLEPFKDDSVVGVQGGVTVPNETNAIGWAESILGFPGGGIRRAWEAKGKNQDTREISTLNCAYRKWVIDKVGGFEGRLKLTGEDYILAKQACNFGRCLFVPKAMVSHESRGNMIKIWHWFVRRGRGDIDVIRVGNWQRVSLGWLIKSSLSIKLSFLIMMSIVFTDWAIIFTFFALLAYGVFQYGRHFKVWKNTEASIMAFLLLPVVKLTMDMAMDWGRFLKITRSS
jgi:glycosyltransferase involved in cell wall biosynthesis